MFVDLSGDETECIFDFCDSKTIELFLILLHVYREQLVPKYISRCGILLIGECLSTDCHILLKLIIDVSNDLDQIKLVDMNVLEYIFMVASQNLSPVARLVINSIDINKQTDNVLLMYSLRNKDIEMIKKYIVKIPSYKCPRENYIYASKHGHLEIIKLLIANDRTPRYKCLQAAIDGNHIETIKFIAGLVTADSGMIRGSIINGNLELFKILTKKKNIKKPKIKKNRSQSKTILDLMKDDINLMKGSEDHVKLAIEYRQFEILKYLLTNYISEKSDRMLIRSLNTKDDDMIMFLLDYNFDIYYASKAAIQLGNINLIKRIIKKHPKNFYIPPRRYCKESSCFRGRLAEDAISNGKIEIFKLFIDDATYKCLESSCHKGYHNIVKLLLKKGIKPKKNLINYKYPKILKLLIKCKDLEIKNPDKMISPDAFKILIS